MSSSNWFRKKTWTPADREDFFVNLNRSRGSFNKAQYLRVQAYELQEVGTEESLQASLQLLEQLFREFPDKSQLAQASTQQGDCLKGLGQLEEALIAYRKAMEIQRQNGSWATGAYCSFAWLIAMTPFPQFYDEALAALDEFGKREVFPIEQYESSASRALINKAKNKFDLARTWAREALTAVSKTNSGFRYHSKLGLVCKPDGTIYEQLKKMSA